jgi:hypothetical protein
MLQVRVSVGPGSGKRSHFKAWRGQRYDFHGACDLVFLQAKEFESGLGLDGQNSYMRPRICPHLQRRTPHQLRCSRESRVRALLPQRCVANAGCRASSLDSSSCMRSLLTSSVFEVHLGGRERIKLKTLRTSFRVD